MNREPGNNVINEIDLRKFLSVLRKSILWVFFILLATNISAYLYLRWTKPLYESNSELKLDIESKASILDLNVPGASNINNLSGEMELIRSKMFFRQVIDSLDIKVSYFSIGSVLEDERYIHSPFVLTSYKVKNPSFYDKRFYVDFVDKGKFRITYNLNGKQFSEVYRFGQEVITSDFEFILELKNELDNNTSDTKFFFVINSDQRLLRYLENNLKVEPLNLNANTIRISFVDHNPYKARDLVSAIDSLYLNYTRFEKTKANKQKIEFLDQQLENVRNQLTTYENNFESFTIINKTTNPDLELSRIIQSIKSLDSQQFRVKNKLVLLRELDKDLDSDKKPYIPLSSANNISTRLINELEKLNKLITEKEMLLATQKENTFAVRRKEQEIELLKSQIKSYLDELKQGYQDQIKELASRKNILEKEFEKLPSKSNDYSKLRRNYDLYETFYLSLMQQKTEFQIAQAGTTTNFKILSAATLPQQPIHPKRLLVYSLGLFGGFLFSFLFIGARYLLHNKVSSVKEIERYLNVPILGTIPVFKSEKIPFTKLIVDSNPRSATSEALRTIRTNIEFMAVGKEKKVISITSTVGGEGKTFVAVNLGGIIAMSKTKVVILDLDMRKPRIHTAFSKPEKPKGVSTLLIRKDTIEDCIENTSLDNLDYIPAGPTPPNPSELILEPTFDELINDLKKRYDVVIFDTPPVGLVTDGILAMKKADLPIYVLRADYSRTGFFDNINRIISVNQFKNMALILNSLKSFASGYGYGYGYHYGYYTDPDKINE